MQSSIRKIDTNPTPVYQYKIHLIMTGQKILFFNISRTSSFLIFRPSCRQNFFFFFLLLPLLSIDRTFKSKNQLIPFYLCSCFIQLDFLFSSLLFIYLFIQLYYSFGISPMRNSGCSPRGKPAATESRYPTCGACWVF